MIPGLARRLRGAVALAAYAGLTLAAPLAHLARHAEDHAHAPLTGAIDWRSVTGTDGRVDLARLARAVGKAPDARHAQAHRTGASHEHGPRRAPGKAHGDGSIAHFGVALGTGVVAPLPTLESPPVWVDFTSARPPGAPVLAHRFVLSQRSQAPPQA